jgi:hypothetical protein
MLEWATESDVDFPGRVEPNAGKKAVGFDDGEAPAASEHNWLFGLAGDWVRYFDDTLTALLTALHARELEQTQINVLDFKLLAGGWAVGAISGAPEAAAANDEMVYAFTLPHGAQVNRVHIQHTQTNTTPNEFNVYARHKTDWPAIGSSSPPALVLPAHGPSETRATVVGPSSIAVSPTAYSVTNTSFVIDNFSDTYVLDCLAGAAGNAVLAIMVEWSKPSLL